MFNVGSGEMVLEYNSTRIDDGLWHRVRATRFIFIIIIIIIIINILFIINSIFTIILLLSLYILFRLEQTASLMVDNGDVITGSAPGNLRQLNAKTGLYIGTC